MTHPAEHTGYPDGGRRKMTIEQIAAPLSDDLELLHRAAEAARARAYAPYSNFEVGAAVRTIDGHVITAGNVENIVSSSTICAERAAIFRAVAEGYTRFDAIAIAGPLGSVSPCGACRQVLAEFMGPTATIVFPLDTAHVVAVPLNTLLPHPFSLPEGPSQQLDG
jgi:cytidine deaminase